MPQKKKASERVDPKIGERLAQARNKMGYTQIQMGEMFGITDVAWRNYERGRRELKSGMILSICAVLKCSPNWLLGYSEEGAHLAENSLMLHQLRKAFDALNAVGQQEAVKRVQELSKLPEYTEQGKKNASESAGA